MATRDAEIIREFGMSWEDYILSDEFLGATSAWSRPGDVVSVGGEKDVDSPFALKQDDGTFTVFHPSEEWIKTMYCRRTCFIHFRFNSMLTVFKDYDPEMVQLAEDLIAGRV